jgi:large subunit ribosomal protein L13
MSKQIKKINKKWFLIDANEKILGRLAVKIAEILQGKHRTDYESYLDKGDYVVVINAEKIKVTGKKPENKLYFRHSGYPGGDKLVKFKDMLKKRPELILFHAVKGMLPQSRLGAKMIKKLKIYAQDKHPHMAQSLLFSTEKGEAK